ncbi:hypothetical protein IFM89_025671 [Coptis chinensis]|uniref:Uncharacterized protein n=1 Tax=Coptis chinensis TaxID=261450 RepID=A0A835HPY7_9MAGN|nr:hypothetical protein IFM89_025671 [Coptis chinensis]
MASMVLGVKQFVVHYRGSWVTTTPGKIKGSDYKGGRRSSTMEFDGDEFCMFDLKKDVQNLVGVGVEFQMASIIQGYICRLTKDEHLLHMWHELKPDRDKKYHLYVFPAPTTSKPTRAPIIPTTASDNSFPPMKSPVKAQPVKAQPVKSQPVKAQPVKAHPVKSTPVKAHPLPTTPKKKSVQVSASVRKSPRFTPTTPIPPPSPIPPPTPIPPPSPIPPPPSKTITTSVLPTTPNKSIKMGEAVRVRRSPREPRFPVYNQSSSNNVQPTEKPLTEKPLSVKPSTVKPLTKKQEKPLRRSGRLQKLKPLVGPNGETLMLDFVSSSDDEVEKIVEVEHVVEVAEPEVAYTVNDVMDDWEHVLGSLDPETFDEVTLGETFTDGDGDALDDKDRSDDGGDKMYEYGYSFGPVFGTVTNNDEWSVDDEDEEDYNYNPSDSDYSVCGADDEALDDMEPIEEEVQNLEEEIQGSDSSVVRVSTNIFEAEEMAKLAGPKVENVFVCVFLCVT